MTLAVGAFATEKLGITGSAPTFTSYQKVFLSKPLTEINHHGHPFSLREKGRGSSRPQRPSSESEHAGVRRPLSQKVGHLVV